MRLGNRSAPEPVARLALRTAREDPGRISIAEPGREGGMGVVRPFVGVGVGARGYLLTTGIPCTSNLPSIMPRLP